MPYSAQSTSTNKSRLKLLHRREEHLQDLFTASREAVVKLSEDEGRYLQFLEGLISQGFLQFMEGNVQLVVRKKDAEIAQKAAYNAANTYKELSGKEVKFEILSTLKDDRYGRLWLI